MAWPKKNTRRVTINGEVYQWHWDPDKALYSWIVIGKKFTDSQLLFLDPYWLSTTPGQVCQAISFALAAGWEPDRKAKLFRLGSHLLDAKTWEFFTLPAETVPGQMPWTLGAGSVEDEGVNALAGERKR